MPKKALLKKHYGFDFPDDFFQFWDFMQALKLVIPDAREISAATDLRLVGPFDVLAGSLAEGDSILPWSLHYRFPKDPPELFTIWMGGADGLHWGYFIDDTRDTARLPIVGYYNHGAYAFWIEGFGACEAYRNILEQSYAQALDAKASDPEWSSRAMARIALIRSVLQEHMPEARPETGDAYVKRYGRPEKTATAMTAEGIGIQVPARLYKQPGYTRDWRSWTGEDVVELVESAHAHIAEGYPGAALQIGKDLWAAGAAHEEAAFAVLEKAYEALGRPVLKDVLLAHKKYRDADTLDITEYCPNEYLSLKKALKEPGKVEVLSLYGQKLESLPEQIGLFTNLVELNLTNNRLTQLPESIGQLANLKVLMLSGNDVRFLPDAVSGLAHLERVDLQGNNLSGSDMERIRRQLPQVRELVFAYLAPPP